MIASPRSQFHKKRDPINEIKSVFIENKGRCGYRRINGWKTNRKAVQQHMRKLGIHGRRYKERKYNSYKGEIGPIADNPLHRDFSANEPYMKIVSDITEVKAPDGKVYLSPAIDLFNGEILGYDISFKADIQQIKHMMQEATPRIPCSTPIRDDSTRLRHSKQC